MLHWLLFYSLEKRKIFCSGKTADLPEHANLFIYKLKIGWDRRVVVGRKNIRQKSRGQMRKGLSWGEEKEEEDRET